MAANAIISARTVETHVQHIMDKFGVSTRAQIAAWSAAAPRPRGPAGPAAGGSAADAGSAAPDHPAAGRASRRKSVTISGISRMPGGLPAAIVSDRIARSVPNCVTGEESCG